MALLATATDALAEAKQCNGRDRDACSGTIPFGCCPALVNDPASPEGLAAAAAWQAYEDAGCFDQTLECSTVRCAAPQPGSCFAPTDTGSCR